MDIQSWYSMNARLSARWGRSADWCWSCQNAIWFWSAARLLNGLLQSEFAELLEVFRAQHLGHQQKEHKVRRENQLENSWGSARSPKCGMKDLHPKCVRNTRRRKMKWAGKAHNSWNWCKRHGQTAAFKKKTKKDETHPSTCTAYCNVLHHLHKGAVPSHGIGRVAPRYRTQTINGINRLVSGTKITKMKSRLIKINVKTFNVHRCTTCLITYQNTTYQNITYQNITYPMKKNHST